MAMVVEAPTRTMMRVTVLTLLAVVTLLVVAPSAASAQAAAQGCPPGQPPGRPPGAPPGNPPVQTGRPQYPPGRCQLALSRSSAARNETFSATGGGFVPGETVTLRLAGRNVGSAVAGDDGTFVAQVTVPSDAPLGRTDVLAAGQSQELSAGFEVVAAAAANDPATATAGAGSTLPRTGTEIAMTALLGVALVALGVFAVTVARRRRVAA
jgi:LPXTG-motif cell wall-anchored protein